MYLITDRAALNREMDNVMQSLVRGVYEENNKDIAKVQEVFLAYVFTKINTANFYRMAYTNSPELDKKIRAFHTLYNNPQHLIAPEGGEKTDQILLCFIKTLNLCTEKATDSKEEADQELKELKQLILSTREKLKHSPDMDRTYAQRERLKNCRTCCAYCIYEWFIELCCTLRKPSQSYLYASSSADNSSGGTHQSDWTVRAHRDRWNWERQYGAERQFIRLWEPLDILERG